MMKNSLCVKIKWGLWNQMFQYAFIKALSLRNKVDFKLDVSWCGIFSRSYELEIFDIDKKYAWIKDIPFYERMKFKNRYFNYLRQVFILPFFVKFDFNHYIERPWIFEEKFLLQKSWYFEWYFQSENYFNDYEKEIRNDFTLLRWMSEKNTNFLRKIEKKNSISLHVRRWDYLNYKDKFQVLSVQYYKDAINFFWRFLDDPVFVFFSDDMDWVRKNFRDKNFLYVDRNFWKNSWQDMILMSKCKHNVIANSTFSWWWGWLNNYKSKIVVAPKKLDVVEWVFNNSFIPKNWIRF